MEKPELQKLIRQIIKEEIVKESVMSDVDLLTDDCIEKLAEYFRGSIQLDADSKYDLKKILQSFATELSKLFQQRVGLK